MTDAVKNWLVSPCAAVDGECSMHGDKSISHRALIFSSLCEGNTTLHNLSDGLDVRATAAAFTDMGVDITGDRSSCTVKGAGLHGLRASAQALDMGNSGTAMRLLCGVLAGQSFASTLTGDVSLSQRPMGRVRDPLQKMGANIELSAADTAPVSVRPSAQIRPIEYVMPVASAQIQSCVLLAGLYANGRTCVSSELVCRDHSARALELFGRHVTVSDSDGRRSVCLDNDPGRELISPTTIDIPGDLSSASFFLVASVLARQARVCLTGINLNPTRDGVLRILAKMGASVEVSNRRLVANEPVADLVVNLKPLRAVELDAADVALAIDEIPVLALACAVAKGTSRIRGAHELRVKESDRIASTAHVLSVLGVPHHCCADGIDIEGVDGFEGGVVDAAGDHRIAMTAAIASVRARRDITVRGVENVATSFPGFAQTVGRIGLNVREF